MMSFFLLLNKIKSFTKNISCYNKNSYLTSLVTTRSGDDVVHLFNLSLSSGERTQSLLGDLSSSLFTGVSDQIDQSSFVWRQTSDFSDQRTDELGSVRSSTLLVRDLWGWGHLGDLLTLVQTNSNTCIK